VGAEHIQHNLLVKNGKAGFIDYLEAMLKAYPDQSISLIRAVAEEDLVALHIYQHWLGDQACVKMDFRFDHQGNIVEHWGVIQTVPEVM
jgi:predicted SnoaL-like aldol condensation-catalyzing enzyme